MVVWPGLGPVISYFLLRRHSGQRQGRREPDAYRHSVRGIPIPAGQDERGRPRREPRPRVVVSRRSPRRPAASAIATRPFGVRRSRTAVRLEIARRQHILRTRVPDQLISPRGLRERVKGVEKRGRGMSTHAPTGFNWPDAMRPLEARRRARAVASFAEYVGKNMHGDRNRAFETLASLVRRRPAAVDAMVLRRAAGHARSAGRR